MDSILDSANAWADSLGSLAGKYLDYRKLEAQSVIDADRARYEAEAARSYSQAGQSAALGVLSNPMLLIGAGLVLFLVLRK